MDSQIPVSPTGYPETRLTIDHLHDMARHYASIHRGDAVLIEAGIAISVLRFFLGDEWYNNNLQPQFAPVDRDHREGRAFMGPDSVAEADRFRMMDRMLLLAEHLYNLQGTEGLEYVIEEIRRMHLPSRFDELICAGMVRIAGVPLRFIRPTKEQHKTFWDFEILWGDRIINVEVEGKGEDTTPTSATLRNALKHAREQLPSEQPGIIFVRIPQDWAESDKVAAWAQEETQRAFRGSNRVVAVVWLWNPVHQIADSTGGIALIVRFPCLNEQSRLLTPDLENFLGWLFGQAHHNWISIQQTAHIFAML